MLQWNVIIFMKMHLQRLPRKMVSVLFPLNANCISNRLRHFQIWDKSWGSLLQMHKVWMKLALMAGGCSESFYLSYWRLDLTLIMASSRPHQMGCFIQIQRLECVSAFACPIDSSHSNHTHLQAPLLNEDFGAHYQFLGMMLGKSLYEHLMVELPFASFFLCKLCDRGNGVVDTHHLASLDPHLYK